jgi:hypothetical protein
MGFSLAMRVCAAAGRAEIRRAFACKALQKLTVFRMEATEREAWMRKESALSTYHLLVQREHDSNIPAIRTHPSNEVIF